MDVGDEVDRLYAGPLEGFTPARDALARKLRKEGRRDEAAEVARLRKPTVAAWVVNQVVRARPRAIQELLSVAEEVKQGRPGAAERFRDAVDELTAAAPHVLSAAGRQPREQVLADVAVTLRAAVATDPQTLAAGRLTHEVEASGFASAFAGSAPRPDAGSTRRKKAERGRRARVDEARRQVETARAEARRLAREADAAERRARRARADAEKAEQRLAEAERRLEAARDDAAAEV